MKKILLLIIFTGIVYGSCDSNARKLVQNYDTIVGCKNNYILWRDGSKLLYDDGSKKSQFKTLLNRADIQDMFRIKYPIGKNSYHAPKRNSDAGRIRNDAFMKKLYGKSKKEVSQSLSSIAWMPKHSNHRVSVTRKHGVAKQLKKVSAELDRLPKRFHKYLLPTAGTFNWRNISGTSRLSVHSFGAAIDLNVKYAGYWKWKKKYHYSNQIPKEIVEIFEKHGFIWGGKWYHYDTMHFEYRPELLD
jgi:hypothetical protein